MRAACYRTVRESFAAAGIPWEACDCEDRGDGAILAVPAEIPKVLLLDPVPELLCVAVTEHNRGAPLDHRIRLRVAVHAGEVTRDEHGLCGNDLVLTCRLLDADELHGALAQADVPVALIVSAHVYDSTVRHRYRGIDATAYHPVAPTVKTTRLQGWIHLPGSTTPPVVDPPVPSVGRAPPRQLRPCVPSFVSRDPELRLLDKLGGLPGRVLVVVGPPGVGKTTLTTQWASQVQDRFPDGQLHTELRGPDGPVAPEQVLGQFLRALGLPGDRVPIDAAEQSALFRSLTSDLRLLVVLDDAVSAAQVLGLLPASPSCLTLVTSRSRLNGLVAAGARFVDVAPLSDEDGVDLLVRLVDDGRVEREPAAARHLAGLCAGLPIALCVAGARLVSHPQWTVAHLVTELLDERRRLARLSLDVDLSLEAVFDVSYESLSPAAARLYRLLGLHPGPDFEIGVAAAALACPAPEAERLLEELLTASLVEETAANRWRLHALIRLHATHEAESAETPEERTAALRRMVDWYLHTATAAGQVVTPHRRDVRRDIAEVPVEPMTFQGHTDALDWLDRERANLLAVARAADREGWPVTAWQLADAMWGLFLYRTYYNDWLQFDLIALQATQDCGDRVAEAGARDRLGLLYHALGRNAEALTYLGQAAEIWHEVGDRHRIAGSMERFGFAYLDEGDVPRALEHFQRALTGYRELGQSRSIGLALISIGRALIEIDEHWEALAPLAEAVAVLDALPVPDPYNKARAELALGRAEVRTGRHESARARLSSVLVAMRALDSPLGEADAAFALGELDERVGDVRQARVSFERTERIYAELGNPGVGRVRERIRALD